MHFVKDARYLSGYKYEIAFEDGSIKVVDLEPYLSGEVFEPLKDSNLFMRGQLDPDTDTLVWENGADFSPDFLYGIGVDKPVAARV